MILIAFIVFYNKLVKAIIGENKMNARLNEFLLDNNIIYFEEYDSVTKNIDSFGNIEKLPYKGLFQEIIGDNERKNTILLSIEKEKEFGTWRQGDLVLVVTRVEKRLYSMFFLNHQKGLAGMEISRNLFEQFLRYIY
mgnify:CR=1 FL=1